MESLPNCRKITLPGRLESLPEFSAFIVDASQALGIDSDSAYKLQLAVEEACVNVIRHGSGGIRAGDRSIALDVRRDGQTCTVTVRDRGSAFDPTSLPPPDLCADLRRRRPGGLGIFLMRQLMDEVRYKAGDGVNTLTMVKRLP
jgi:serine/threonine-protein kinase RsbW